MAVELEEAPHVKDKPIYHAGKSERGDKFRTVLKNLEDLPSPEKKEEPVVGEEVKKDEVKPEVKSEKKTEKKPASPLDVLVKPAEKETKTEDSAADPLKEFDDKQPNWKRAREVIGKQSSLLKNLSSEITRLKTVQVDPKAQDERESLIRERDELKSKIANQERDIKAIDGRYSDEYRGLEKERNAAAKKAVDRFESYAGKGKGDSLQEALSLPIGRFRSDQIKEVLAELDSDDRARVLTLIENAEGVEDKLRDFESNLPEKWEEIQQRRDAQLQEKNQQAVKSVQVNFQKVAESLPEKNITLRLVDEKDDDGTWNSDIRSAMDEAGRAILPNGATFNETAEIYVKGKMYDRLESRLVKLYSEYSEAMKRLAEFDSGEVDFKGSKKAPEKKLPEKGSDRYRAAMQALTSGGMEEI